MACSSDVARKVMRLKLQLTDTADSATVIKTLQKLKDLDITLDILAETGIGKTVNSLRRHKRAGEYAKSLVKGWKKLIPNESTSHTDDRNVSQSLSVKDKVVDKNSSTRGSLTMEDLNNNSLTSHSIKSQDSSDDPFFQPGNRKDDLGMQQCEEQKRKRDQIENEEISQQENNMSHVLKKKIQIQENKTDSYVFSKKKKNYHSNKKSGDVDTLLRQKNSSEEDTPEKPRSDATEKIKSISDSGRFGSEKESKESSKEDKESCSFESRQKYSNMLRLGNVKDERSSRTSKSSEGQNRNGKKSGKETREHKQESESKKHSKHKKAKIKHQDRECDSDQDEPSMSFESYLNYDLNVFKRKERCATKKPPKKIKNEAKEEATKDPSKSFKSPLMSINVTSLKEMSVMDLMSIPLPAVLPECEKPFSVEYFEKRVEKEPEFCDISEESAVFTGQRLNRKMQVYSGAKTIFLPTMMSLYQQCIRTLQNNINLLHETGGVPFEILEPVLERCTPEQLLRVEECNPIYIGVTDHLWEKHCQRDFKESKLQEYESWKEMYIRLSEERERKLKRLTKSIVSAHSQKPKGRQVKMAFIHTVAKPPRDVRIQQEIHGTAVQQPHQQRCSVKVQDNRSRQSCNEPSRPSSTSSAASNTQDPRKKTRVAPMMAKSLKAFKKQLGRR
ncbi:Elongin-A [Channa argus]|uniref:Elongin-A n=1 Tax=Channa argus TaxID=215402 RepID=A0A6G1R0S5_CHAAH|nr:Elongin-A [Channa argus]KAK2921953.1 hypothetical protein Q8A73_001438 [Channa argus]